MAKIVENALVVYTDGSLKWEGRRGGYGAVFVHFDDVGNETIVSEHAPPGIVGTTGNRMELQAVIDAIKLAPRCDCYPGVGRIVIRTDSQYVSENYRNAIFRWSKQRWQLNDGSPVSNAELWKELVRLCRNAEKRIDIEWVKGHGKGRQKDPYNYAADKLAKASRNSPLSRREYRSSVRRKLSPLKTIKGSIKAEGQTLAVHVIENLPMRSHRAWRYRAEVMTQESPYFQCVDWLDSNEHLRDGHFYEVRLNDNPTHSVIAEVIREVDRDGNEVEA